MFGIGFGELFILVAIGIIVLGPERCVGVAKTLGTMVKKFRKEWGKVKQDLSVNEEIKDLKKEIDSVKEIDLKKDFDFTKDIEDIKNIVNEDKTKEEDNNKNSDEKPKR